VKEARHAFVEEASKDAQGKGQQIADHRRRSPGMNPEYDGQFTQLNSFADAQHHIGALSEVRQRYGVDEANLLVLWFLYAYLAATPAMVFDENCFESIWSRVRRELSSIQWRHVGITILQTFTSALGRIEIADDVAVCLRTLEDM
jgi:hypothetical protein